MKSGKDNAAWRELSSVQSSESGESVMWMVVELGKEANRVGMAHEICVSLVESGFEAA